MALRVTELLLRLHGDGDVAMRQSGCGSSVDALLADGCALDHLPTDTEVDATGAQDGRELFSDAASNADRLCVAHTHALRAALCEQLWYRAKSDSKMPEADVVPGVGAVSSSTGSTGASVQGARVVPDSQLLVGCNRVNAAFRVAIMAASSATDYDLVDDLCCRHAVFLADALTSRRWDEHGVAALKSMAGHLAHLKGAIDANRRSQLQLLPQHYAVHFVGPGFTQVCFLEDLGWGVTAL